MASLLSLLTALPFITIPSPHYCLFSERNSSQRHRRDRIIDRCLALSWFSLRPPFPKRYAQIVVYKEDSIFRRFATEVYARATFQLLSLPPHFCTIKDLHGGQYWHVFKVKWGPNRLKKVPIYKMWKRGELFRLRYPADSKGLVPALFINTTTWMFYMNTYIVV